MCLLDNTLAKLGTISFSLYLLHMLIYDFIYAADITNILKAEYNFIGNYSELFMASAIYIPVIILLSFLSYNVIEKPFLEMRVKYFKS